MKAFDRFRLLLSKRKAFFSILLSMLLLIAVPMLCTGFLYSGYLSRSYTQKLQRTHKQMVENFHKDFDKTFAECKRISFQLRTHQYLSYEYLASSSAAFLDVGELLSNYIDVNEKIDDIFFVHAKDGRIFSSDCIYTPSLFQYEPTYTPDTWVHYQNLLFQKEDYITSDRLDNMVIDSTGTHLEYIVSGRSSDLMIGFRLSTDTLLRDVRGASFDIAILDAAGRLLCSTSNTLDAQSYEEFLRSRSDALVSDEITLNDSIYYIEDYASDILDMHLISLAPHDALYAEFDQVNRVIIVVYALVFAVCLILLFLLAHYNYRPLREIHQTIDMFPEDVPDAFSESAAITFKLNALFKKYNQIEREQRETHKAVLLSKVLRNEWTADMFDTLRSAGVDADGMRMFVLVVTLPFDEENLSLQPDLEFQLSRTYRIFVDRLTLQNRLAVLLMRPQDAPEDDEFQLGEIVNYLLSKYGYIFSCGAGGRCTDLREIYRSFNEARIALRLCSLSTDRVLFFYGESGHDLPALPYPRAELDALSAAIESRDAAQIQLLTDKLITMAYGHFPGMASSLCLCYDIVNTMLRAAHHNTLLSVILQSSNLYRPEALEFLSLNDFEGFVRSLCDIILQNCASDSTLFDRSVDYIRDNICSLELYPETVAQQMDTSVSTLNQIFKTNIGQTLSDFIINMRHEYAKQRLLASTISIADLSQQLGYSQPSSFIRSFKAREGMTPGQYKAQFSDSEEEM